MTLLSGLICVRNGDELDYCWRESARSLLPAVDEMIICDGESTDGTQEEIRRWMEAEPKIRLCVYPWPNPVGDIKFWVKWLQYGRSHCRGGYVLQLDADEILHEKSVPLVRLFLDRIEPGERRSAWCHRHNFWGDSQHLIPPGVCLSHRVVRLLPQDVYLPSDGPDESGSQAVSMAVETDIEIFHYGFLRKRKAFFKKAKGLQRMFFDTYDERLARVEGHDNWMKTIPDVPWVEQLLPFSGVHPKSMTSWLRERGHQL